MKVTEHIGVALEPLDIEFAHRVQPRSTVNASHARPIVVRFRQRISKDRVVAAARKHRNMTARDMGIGGESNKIFVNEHLTKENKILLGLCKRQAKEANYRSEWERDDLESLWVTVPARCLGSSRDLHIAIVYIPPNSLLSPRIQIFLEVLSVVCSSSCGSFIILGDFNLPCISWVSGEPKVLRKGLVEVQNSASDLIAQFSFLDLLQYNMIPNKFNNILDLVVSDLSLTVCKSTSSLVKEDPAHPSLRIIASDFLIPPLRPRARNVYQFKRGDYSNIHDSLIKHDWSFIKDEVDIEQVVCLFYEVLYEVINKFVPLVRCHGSYSYPIWYSRALIKVIKEKSKKHQDWKKYNNPVDYADFAELRVKQKVLQTECYQAYVNYSQEKIKSHPKYFWSYVKSRRKGSSCYPQQMTFVDKVINEQVDICSAFNEFFMGNFNKPADQYNTEQVEELGLDIEQ
ncbi:Uncharacterized protein OBRU01_08030 [Operophtera brumata]|uniref:Endonuclease/exonuclease/phosphatase domain-containing protein n=1 Tax=Operophtera brumata TaxID=104452 RepID=A0A0L7LH13_OPEBR|nr:Uncharacterized protein OBRU01_08030 [Operophtera brumata]